MQKKVKVKGHFKTKTATRKKVKRKISTQREMIEVKNLTNLNIGFVEILVKEYEKKGITPFLKRIVIRWGEPSDCRLLPDGTMVLATSNSSKIFSYFGEKVLLDTPEENLLAALFFNIEKLLQHCKHHATNDREWREIDDRVAETTLKKIKKYKGKIASLNERWERERPKSTQTKHSSDELEKWRKSIWG